MDPHDLQRFVTAQDAVYGQVCGELRAGEKRTHWMWFIFPQLAVLGRSAMAKRYGISGAHEAAAYLAHPVLGARLRECAGLVLAVEGRSARDIFGETDAMKLRSSMTLFAEAAAGETVFQAALDRFFGGEPDPLTLRHLRQP